MLSGRIALERPEVDQLAVTTTVEQPALPERHHMTYRRRVWPKRRKPVRSSMSLAAARARKAAEKARAEANA